MQWCNLNLLDGSLNQEEIFNYTLYLSDASIYALCSSPIMGIENCSIRYTTDYSYENLSPPIMGPINTPFQIIPEGVISAAVYYHQASVIVDPSMKITVRSRDIIYNFETESSCDTVSTNPLLPTITTFQLPVSHLGVFGAIVALLLFTVIISISSTAVLVCKGKCQYCIVPNKIF